MTGVQTCALPICRCGRTQDEEGLCDGSHGLTNEEYQKRLDKLLKENKQQLLNEDTRD